MFVFMTKKRPAKVVIVVSLSPAIVLRSVLPFATVAIKIDENIEIHLLYNSYLSSTITNFHAFIKRQFSADTLSQS